MTASSAVARPTTRDPGAAIGISRWPAPAKLNLFLHIVGRRSDGYHLLQTVFQLLDWGDELAVSVRDDGVIRRAHDLVGVSEDQDLIIRAAQLLKARTGTSLGADLALTKRIPLGGGLGGGSSDAATTLVALNASWKTGLDVGTLAALGLRLGADVPVFVRGRSAWAEGIGERLTPIALPQRWFVVLDPGSRVETAAIFQTPDLTRNSQPTTIARFLAGEVTRNELEPVVRSRFPGVAAALDWLGAQAPARLTGSGGCVFATVADRSEADRIAGICPAEWHAVVARGVDVSPLQVALGNAGNG